MTHDEAFLQAVLEHPHDDAPRLMYADWLEERGDPRGEFIRVQCQLAAASEEERRMQWSAREQALLAVYEPEWTASLRGLVVSCKFRRGFIDEIVTDAPTFLDHAATLFRLAPIRRLKLRDPAGPYLGELADCSHLARLSALSLEASGLQDEHLVEFATSPYLTHLQSLDLSGNRLNDRGLAAVLTSPAFDGLTELNLSGNPFDFLAMGIPAESIRLFHLTRLRMAECQLGDFEVEQLAGYPGMLRLRDLDLSGNPFGPSGLRALMRSPNLANVVRLFLSQNARAGAEALTGPSALRALRHLDLSAANLHDSESGTLSRIDLFGQLESLNLDHNDLRDADVSHLLQAGLSPRLTALSLSHNRIGVAGARALASAAGLRRLCRLNLRFNSLGEEGVAALLQASWLAEVRELLLGRNFLGPRGVRVLAECTSLHSLEALDLSLNNVGDAGAAVLAETSAMPQLTALDLRSNRIGDGGLEVLMASASLPSLVALDLRQNPVTREGVRGVRTASGLPQLRRLGLATAGLSPEEVRETALHFAGRIAG